jgi:Domain of unknown function (DUF305)
MSAASMTDRIKLMTALGAAAMAGIVLASLVLTLHLSAGSRNVTGASHHHVNPIPFSRGATDAPQSTFHSGMTTVNARMHADMAIAPSGDVDRDFMQMMIPHHQGAIDMALALLKHGRDEKVKRLAQSIIIEQTQEIAYMRSLLATPGEICTPRPDTDP